MRKATSCSTASLRPSSELMDLTNSGLAPWMRMATRSSAETSLETVSDFADEFGRDAVDAEGDEFVDGEAFAEECVDFLGEFGADAVNTHRDQIVRIRLFRKKLDH